MKKILVAFPFKVFPLTDEQKKFLNDCAEGHEVEFKFVDYYDMTLDDVKDVNCIIGSVKRKFVKAAENLEWLQIAYAGADLFTESGLMKDDAILTNASGAYNTEVSEHMLALTFSLIRHLNQYSRQQVNHQWQRVDKKIISIKNSTILILGLGRIGLDYAMKVKSLGAKVIGVKRSFSNKPNCVDELQTIDKLDEVIGRADIVAMVLPGVEDTNKIINAQRLKKFKRGAYLINVGRGNAIDSDALKFALKNNLIGGVALDVTDPEPLPIDDELWNFDNVVITPHVAGQLYLRESFDYIVELAGNNLKNFLNGQPLKNIVNRKLGY